MSWQEWIDSGRKQDAKRDELLAEYLPRLRVMCRKYADRYNTPDDLLGPAWLALIESAQGYTPDTGTFWRYAAARIRGALIDTIQANHGLTRYHRAALNDLARARIDMMHELGRQPTPDELCERLGWSWEKWREVHLYQPEEAHPVFDEEPLPEMNADRRVRFDSLTDELPFYERLALFLHHYCHMSQTDVSDMLGCSDSYVSRLLSVAHDRLYEQWGDDAASILRGAG